MNTSQINGALLGNGTPDHRTFLSLVVTAFASTSATLIAIRTLAATLLARATAALLMSGKAYYTGSASCTATGVMTLTQLSPNMLTGNTAGTANGTMVLIAKKKLDGSVTGAASTMVLLSRRVVLTGAVTGAATSSITLLVSGKPAPVERQMWLVPDNRTMVL